MDRHIGTKSGDLFRKSVSCFVGQAFNPKPKGLLRCVIEPSPLLLGHALRLQNRRKLRLVKNLIRVRVTDSTNKTRVRERALERMIFFGKHRLESVQRRREWVDSARVKGGEGVFSAKQRY